MGDKLLFDLNVYNYRLVIFWCTGHDQLYTSTMDSKTMQFERTSSSEGDKNPCVWSSPEGGQRIDIGKQIFCNRSLNMRSIVAVGFDMDYTLAQYKPETFESLAYEGTVKKLVHDLGYPAEVSIFLS